MLDQLADVPDEHRGAHFACAAALVLPSGEERVVEGRVAGVLIRAAAGHRRLRLRPDLRADWVTSSTTAEMPAEEKNAISHRGEAFRALAPVLRELLG